MKTFIEIGTCDFDTNLSLIASGNWNGVMVEASPFIFNSLSEKVQISKHNNNVFLVNKAVSDRDGKIDFAVTKDNKDWSRGIGTVIDANHTGTCLYDLADNATKLYASVIEVPCVTLDSLVAEYSFLGGIDFLKLDTEGHELTILKNYSWRVKPTFIKLEHIHVDDLAIRAILEAQGYIVWTEAQDMYAII
jgi:FkbM family methyltransferase